MRSFVRSTIFLSALATAALVSAPAAHAQVQTISFQGVVPETPVSFSQNLQLNRFNTAFGTLIGVQIDVTTSVTARIRVFNDTGAQGSFTQVQGSVPLTISGPSNVNILATPTAQVTFSPARTIEDGASAVFTGVTGTSSSSASVPLSGFAAYQGTGAQTVQLTVAAGNASASGTGTPDLLYAATARAGATVRVTYSYVATPEPSAFGMLAIGVSPVAIVAVRRRRKA